MTAKFLAISVLAMFLCCAESRAAEPAAASKDAKPAKDPELVARLDVQGLMSFTQRAGRFADRIKPGSSGMLALALVGLTVNPQLANYDMSRPFSLLVYSEPNGVVAGKWGFCGVVWRRRAESPPFMKLASFDLSVRDVGSRSALASSDAILRRLPDDLQKDPSDEPADDAPSFRFRSDAKRVLDSFPLADLVAPEPKSAEPLPPEKLEALRNKRVKWQSFENVLRQAKELRCSISMSPDARLLLELEAVPLPESPLDTLLKEQAASPGVMPGSVAASGASLYGAFSIKPTKDLIGAIGSLYKSLASASGKDRSASAYANFAVALSEASDGGAGFCAGLRNGAPFELLRVETGKNREARLKVEKAFAEIGERAETPGARLLHSWKSGVSCYGLLDSGSMWILTGKLSSDDADAIFATKRVAAPATAEPGLLGFVSTDPDPSGVKTLRVAAKKGSLAIKLDVAPSDLESLPLPTPPPSSSQGAQDFQ